MFNQTYYDEAIIIIAFGFSLKPLNFYIGFNFCLVDHAQFL